MVKKNVLFIINALSAGGMEAVVYGIVSRINTEEYNVHIITFLERDISQFNRFDRIGCKITIIPRIKCGVLSFMKTLRRYVSDNHIDIVNTLIDYAGLVVCWSLIGKKCKIICQSHSNRLLFENPQKRMLVNILFKLSQCEKLAVSKEAGISMFGKSDFILINNGIDTNKYAYSHEIRNKIRNDLNIENKLVIGNVGRLTYQKNHTKLLDIFNEIKKINDNAILLIVGDGEEEQNIKNKIKDLNLSKYVIMLGQRHDVDQILQAMDVFILPSHFEGMPIALIEAQCTGLLCFTTLNVTREVNLTGNVEFISQEEKSSIWAKFILDKLSEYNRKDEGITLKNKNYDKESTYYKYIELFQVEK